MTIELKYSIIIFMNNGDFMKSRLTIRDIANEAGVSIGTVSRVLNRADNVDPEIYNKTIKVIERNNYNPLRKTRKSAKDANSKRHGNIAIMFNMTDGWKGSQLLSDYMVGIERACKSRGYNALLHMKSSFSDADLMPQLKEKVDGVLVKGEFNCGEQCNAINAISSELPVVGFGMNNPICRFSQISLDNYAAAMLATEELISLGHKRIAFISTNPQHQMFITRGQGYSVIMKKYGFYDPELLLEEEVPGVGAGIHEDSPPDLSLVLEKLLNLKEKPTAVVLCNDWGAAGFYRACEGAGLSIPGDFSVVGFDNVASVCQLLSPQLSTIDNPFQQIGELAVNTLINRIEHPSLSLKNMASIQYLPGIFIKRNSVIEIES